MTRIEELRTTRLVLRRPVGADVDAIARIHRDPRACAHNPGDAIGTRAEAEERFRSWDAHWERHGFGYRTVCRGGTVVGFCGVKRMELRGRPVLNLFYRLDPAVWGGGIATEAARAVVEWVTDHRPGEMLIARVRPANVGSRIVAERAGLRREPALDTRGEDGLDWIFVGPATPRKAPDGAAARGDRGRQPPEAGFRC